MTMHLAQSVSKRLDEDYASPSWVSVGNDDDAPPASVFVVVDDEVPPSNVLERVCDEDVSLVPALERYKEVVPQPCT